MDNDIDIDAFWADLRPFSPSPNAWAQTVAWVQSEEPTLDLREPNLSALRTWLCNRDDTIRIEPGPSVLDRVIASLKRRYTHTILGPRDWSFLGGFITHTMIEVLPEVHRTARLYELVMEVRFAFEETLPWEETRATLQAFTQHLEENPEDGLLFYRWCHLNEYVPRTILFFDAYDSASADENADVDRILTHAGPALGVIRGYAS